MNTTWDVFVEGTSDKIFLQCLLKHLGISHIRTSVIGGGVSKLRVAEVDIRRSSGRGNKIAILLDANSNLSNRRVEFQNERDELNLPIKDNHCFLVPNNQDLGDLETLLERISVTEHRIVYDCFEQYENCLRNAAKSYRVPDRKAKIYAYCSALKSKTHPDERNYCDRRYWDLNASAVEPLRQFLFSLPR